MKLRIKRVTSGNKSVRYHVQQRRFGVWWTKTYGYRCRFSATFDSFDRAVEYAEQVEAGYLERCRKAAERRASNHVANSKIVWRNVAVKRRGFFGKFLDFLGL